MLTRYVCSFSGSVKSNLGHLEGASGLAGILKAIFVLEKGIIPPNALFEKLNPDIDAEFLRVEVPAHPIPWPSPGLRRVSINGFGFGGSNTHVILDDALHYLQDHQLKGNHCTAAAAPGLEASTIAAVVADAKSDVSLSDDVPVMADADGTVTPDTSITYESDSSIVLIQPPVLVAKPDPQVLVFSAFDEKAAKRTIDGYSKWYQTRIKTPDDVEALAHTLSSRRSHMRWRSFAVAGSHLDGQEEQRISPSKPVRVASDPALGWIFTGQGAQYVGMGLELAGRYPVFRDALKRVDGIYTAFGCEWSIFGKFRGRFVGGVESARN